MMARIEGYITYLARKPLPSQLIVSSDDLITNNSLNIWQKYFPPQLIVPKHIRGMVVFFKFNCLTGWRARDRFADH